MPAKQLSSITATPGQPESSVVFTSGSTIQIDAPADKVFQVLLDANAYSDWNTWSPSLTFPENESITTPDVVGILHCDQPEQKRSYDIPVQILEVSSSPSDRSILSWRSLYMPAWFAIAERVQTVERISDSQCALRQWESMSGWGAYLLKYVLGVQQVLDNLNLNYAQEVKTRAEKVHATG